MCVFVICVLRADNGELAMSGIESIGSSEEVINSEYEEELVVLSITEGEKTKKKKKASKSKKKKSRKDKKEAKSKKGKKRDDDSSKERGSTTKVAKLARKPIETSFPDLAPLKQHDHIEPAKEEAGKPDLATHDQTKDGAKADQPTAAKAVAPPKEEGQKEAAEEDSDIMEIGVDDDGDDLEVVGGEEALAAAKARVEAAAAKAAAREKRKAEETAAKKLRKLEEAAAKERRRLEEQALREESLRLEAQRRAALEAAGREALRQREQEDKKRREAELKEAQRQLQRREAERAAMLQAAQKELLQREAERERAKKKAVGQVKFNEAGSFANFGSFDAKRSLAEAHGQADKKADGAGSVGDSSNDSEDSQESAAEQEGQSRRNPTKFRPPSLWTDPSAALQDDTHQVEWDQSPTDLLPREEVATPAAFVEHFARFTIGAWRRELSKPVPFEGKGLQETELAVFKSRQSLQQIERAVAPLIKQLGRNEANDEVVQQLDKMVTLAEKREYAEAGAAYITMALGHKKWNQTHATYAGAVGQNKGCRTYKTYQDKLLEYDKDPVVQKYIQCMRKLVHFVQFIRPNDDVAKHLHI